MRNLLLCLLLATTAAPAVAQSEPDERQSRREAREAARAERQAERAERAESVERAAPRERERAPAVERRVPVMEWPDGDRLPPVRRDRRPDPTASLGEERVQPRLPRRDRPLVDSPGADSVANWRRDQRDILRERDPERVARGPLRPRVQPPREARPDRPAPLPATAAVASHRTPRWTSSWRGDRRYDWRRHRDRHRSLFRIGLYFDPFGWNYRRFGIGWRLWPSYYSRSYWLDDPFMYRLPYAPHPYRWIRYWDDALLVNMYTGQVVDVERNFFW